MKWDDRTAGGAPSTLVFPSIDGTNCRFSADHRSGRAWPPRRVKRQGRLCHPKVEVQRTKERRGNNMAITEQPKRPKILSRLTIGEIALLAWNYVVVVRILPWSAGLVWWAGLLLILGGPLAIAVSIIGFRTETR